MTKSVIIGEGIGVRKCYFSNCSLFTRNKEYETSDGSVILVNFDNATVSSVNGVFY